MSEKKIYGFALIFSFILSIIILRGFIFNSGFAQYRDLIWPYHSEYWYKLGRYVWDEYLQQQTQIQQKIVYFWLSFFPPDFSERLIYVIIFTLMGISSFSLAYKITKSKFTSLLTSLYFVFSPLVVYRIQHRLLLLSYALTPFLFLICHDTLSRVQFLKNKTLLKRAIITSFLLAFMSTSPHWIIFSAFLLFYIWITNFKLSRSYFIRSFAFFVLILLGYSGFSAYWILPYLLYSPTPPYVHTEETVFILSRNSELLNTLRMHSYWWPADLFSNPPIPTFVWLLATFLIPILAFLPVTFRHKNYRLIVLTALLAVILIFLGKGTNHPLGNFYTWLAFKSPMAPSVGWLFRDPYKWIFLLSFVYAFLIGIFALGIFRKIWETKRKVLHYISPVIFVILLLIPLLNAYPLLTGDLNGKIRPYNIPDDYAQLNTWLDGQSAEFKVASYPCPPPWQFPKPTISYDFYWNYLINVLLANRTNKLGELLKPWNVKYIIIRTQIFKSETESQKILSLFEKSDKIINSLQTQKDIKFVGRIRSLYIFENLAYINRSLTSSQILGIFGGLNNCLLYTSPSPRD